MNTYGIREVARRMEIPASTLRYYEEMGLLSDVKRDPNGQRIYTDVHINRLEAIKCFRETGLSISKMNAFFRYEQNLEENIDAIVSLIDEHEQDMEQKIALLEKNLAHIKHKVWFYHEIRHAMESGTLYPKWEEYPEQEPSP